MKFLYVLLALFILLSFLFHGLNKRNDRIIKENDIKIEKFLDKQKTKPKIII